MIPHDNLKINGGQSTDLRHAVAGELQSDYSYSSEHYTTEGETSGRDTDYEKAQESSDGKVADRACEKGGVDFMAAGSRRHHKSESMSRRRKKKKGLRRVRSIEVQQNSEYDEEDAEDLDRIPCSPRGDSPLSRRVRPKRSSKSGSTKGSRSKRSGDVVSRERTVSGESSHDKASSLAPIVVNSAE